MATWTNDELNKVGSAEELQISGLRPDGTLREKLTIWVVRISDDLYVRSAKGHSGIWYNKALVTHKGRIWDGGVEKNVSFVEISDAALNDKIDAEYLSKYGRYPQFVAPMVTDEVKETTLKLEPR